jgi:hypothetical protein
MTSDQRPEVDGNSGSSGSVIYHWYDYPDEVWYTPVEEELSAGAYAEIKIPINEDAVRRLARSMGMLVERLRDGRYRLWDIDGFVKGYQRDPVPFDLTAHGHYVDSLAGLAYVLQVMSECW